jgi:hypothetical protein
MKRNVNVVFEGPIFENYDRYLGPVLFWPFADDIAARLKEAQFASVLEIEFAAFPGQFCQISRTIR